MRQFNVNRRMLSIILCIVLICTFTLSIAYAALSAVLTINGNAEVVASNWNIHLDNPRVSSGSVTKTLPVISGNTMTFSSSLVDPGDFYEFTVDVVNDGSIDAMIDSVSVTPTLTDSQKKYLRYEVTYQNGESISSKQTLRKGSSMPIKVRVEFRSDIPVSDLPSTATSLNHKVALVYSQSDGTGSSVVDDGVYILFKVGNEHCIGDECFYVISSDDTTVTLLAKYNLYVGSYSPDGSIHTSYGDEATGIQNSLMRGYISSTEMRHGVARFAGSAYWSSTISSYPAYVYNDNSNLYGYLENYKTYLSGNGANINEIRTIKLEELETFGCSLDEHKCVNSPSFIYATSYWVGTAVTADSVVRVRSDNRIDEFTVGGTAGVRPVINVPKWQFADEIEFTLNGWAFTAKEGMTWVDFINSNYNNHGDFGVRDEFESVAVGWNDEIDDWMEDVYLDESLDTFAYIDDVIIPGGIYYSG